MRGDRVGGGLEFADQLEVGDTVGEPAVELLVDEAGGAAGDVDELADQVRIHARDEVVEVEVDVLHAAVQLRRVVVAQPLGVEALFEIARRGDESAARLRHLLPVHGEKAVCVDRARQAVAGKFQHRRPEQRVEIQDVLADEVHQLGFRIRPPPGIEIEAVVLRVAGEARHVAYRRVEPDIEILARRAGNLEAEIGRVAADVPVRQAGGEPFLHLVGGLVLQRARFRPFAQEGLAVAELEEMVLGIPVHRRRPRYCRQRILQVGRAVGGAAGLAVVAVLVRRAALRTFALDEAVRQEHVLHRVVQLRDRLHLDESGVLQRKINLRGEYAVFLRMRRVVMVEADVETREVARVLVPHTLDQRLRSDVLLLRAQHDRRAMCVVRAHVTAVVSAHFLEAHPDVGLDVFDQMAEMDAAVGVGQGGSDEDLAGHDRAKRRKGAILAPERGW